MSEVGGLSVVRTDGFAIARIDRPKARNALSESMIEALRDLADGAADDETLRAIVLTGVGDVFASGADLKELEQFAGSKGGLERVRRMGEAFEQLERCHVPVIAAVQGHAYGGGCELILACDLVVIEEQATLSFRQAPMGLSTAWGGATRLIERAGRAAASRMLLLGDAVTAEELFSLGVVNQVAAQGLGLASALGWARHMAKHPRDAVAGTKRSLYEARHAARGDALAREWTVFTALWNGPSHKAAMKAFLSKR